MKLILKILRISVITLLVMIPVVPSLLYIFLSVPAVQHVAGRRIEKELSLLLGTTVSIGHVNIEPFNRVTLTDVTVCDSAGIEALSIGHLGAGINLTELIFSQRVVVSYTELLDLHATVYRDSISSPINIEPIIEKFKPKDPLRPPTLFDLAINIVVMRRATVSYDVLSAPEPEKGHFDTNHIKISDLRADIKLPRIKNNDFLIQVKRLAANERSGLSLKELSGTFALSDTAATVTGLTVDLPDSHLAIGDIRASYSSLKTIAGDIIDSPVTLLVLPGSYVTLMDLAAFAPGLTDVDARADIEIDLSGTVNNMALNHLDITAYSENVWIRGTGHITGLAMGGDNLHIDINRLNISAGAREVNAIAEYFAVLSPDIKTMISGAAHINLLGDLTASRREMGFDGSIITDPGNIDIDVVAALPRDNYPLQLQGSIETDEYTPSTLFPSLQGKMGKVGFHSEFDLSIGQGSDINGDLLAIADHIEWNGYRYAAIEASINFHDHIAEGIISSDNPALDFTVRGETGVGKKFPHTEFYADVRNIDFAPFVKTGTYHDYSLSLSAEASIDGHDPDTAVGWLTLDNIEFTDGAEKSLLIDTVSIEARMAEKTRIISIKSDFADGRIRGRYPVKEIVPTARQILRKVYPQLLGNNISSIPGKKGNKQLRKAKIVTPELPEIDFDFNFHLKPDTVISPFFNLPVSLLDAVNIAGAIESEASQMSFSIDAPYLRKNDKMIENTALRINIDGNNNKSSIYASSVMPTKNGPMILILHASGSDDVTDTDLGWHIRNNNDYHGNFNFTTVFKRDTIDKDLVTRIHVNPSTIVFNNTAWSVNPSVVDARKGYVRVNGFTAGREDQFIEIDGIASADSTDVLNLKLRDINLDYIFETLNINNVTFGGNATGEFYASSLFLGKPVLYTPRLDVKGMKYNNCVMGDARIVSSWDNNGKAITIDADINNNDHHLLIDGIIGPSTGILDLYFDIDHSPAAFLQPFMSAFAEEVSGNISGNARLYGTFKNLDLTGDVLAEDLSLKLGITNTTYSTTDSVHIRPGRIEFNDMRLTDMHGKTAILSGWLAHSYFHDARYNFDIHDARDFLCYDIPHNESDPWSGTIFGNGRVTIDGRPGYVGIKVNIATAPRSTFSYTMSDSESATEYDFITFRDRNRHIRDSIRALDPTPVLVRRMRNRIRRESDGPPSVYDMTFAIEVTPQATINLIMNPVTGDRITANGYGDIEMKYRSDGNLSMRGTYTVEHGSYNFTLQDIIIKEFTIDSGSSITFNGDPNSAELDITAICSINANLSDLDESFLQDKELNRTNVKVNAILLASGDMRHPDIAFDLKFPTLTQDVERKVKSIVSTEDMMNRQIIYLLALNRFYTPDYMTATRGNELVSVASSTISSQLSSMLGQLSDKWSIAPQFRSDRGDFSDLEVDVALSSHLLNNRLLLNGNFGYRDKSLNNNSFIGDFDVEYLLNRPGSIRLKAYNRYNDQNYYLKSALTTQGIGIVFKRDFDNIFSFLNPYHNIFRHKEQNDSVPADE